jgi:GDP/UDP-N,N'-diacetylbacillosamine 2-epimerase (hydrolysing)
VSVRHICVWSGKRGGFGALTPTMQEICRRPSLRLSVVVTDQHLYERFGRTITEVKERFPIAAAIDMEQRGDSNRDRARAIGTCLTKSADVLADLSPDVLLVIGDRGEVLAATVAAHNLRIAVAHVQGGDVSGSLDEPVRHAVTKLAHVHFPSTPESAKRLLEMGEEPWRVHVVGDTHIDQILLQRATPSDVLRVRYELPTDVPVLVVLQHPDSTIPEASATHMAETLAAVCSFGYRIIVVYPCSDQGFEGIIDVIERYREQRGVSIHRNIPAEDFIGLQRLAACLVGNSSAGLIEAPYFDLPAVNVGDRQIGRERAKNVIDVPPERDAITRAIDRALHDVSFRARLTERPLPFGDGTAFTRIVDVLESVPIDARLLNKRMTY